MTTMYGIANCDTIKKAKKWLEANGVEYQFHDYKKAGADTIVLDKAIVQEGIDVIMNKRGTTYRKLSDDEKNAITSETIVNVLSKNTSMIKRPIIVHNDKLIVGFNEAKYREFFDLA
jgi:Spx/MgsR family transcriptional regulator